MAHPITFKPLPVDPKLELMRQLDAAPQEHAEALLSLYKLVETAHEQGMLDLARGVIGGRDVLAEKLGEGMALPETIAALRNGIALARLLGSVDPDVVQKIVKSMSESIAPTLRRQKQEGVAKKSPLSAASRPPGRDVPAVRPEELQQRKQAQEPPSLWQIFKRASSKDGRRGLAFAVHALTAVGRALGPEKD